MKTHRLVFVPMLGTLFALSACNEPQAPASQAPAAPAASEPAAASPPPPVVGVKPVDAVDALPPGPLSISAINEFCNVESINGTVYTDSNPIAVSRGETVKVAGWIVDKTTDSLATDVSLVIEKIDLTQRWTVTGMAPTPRQDVADYNKFPPALVNSGFVAELDLSAFEPGTYHLFLTRTVGPDVVACDNSRQIDLK